MTTLSSYRSHVVKEHPSGHISVTRPQKVICYLQFQKLKKAKCLYFIDFWPWDWDMITLSPSRSHIVKDNHIIWQNGNISVHRQKIKKIKAFLQLSKLKKSRCPFFTFCLGAEIWPIWIFIGSTRLSFSPRIWGSNPQEIFKSDREYMSKSWKHTMNIWIWRWGGMVQQYQIVTARNWADGGRIQCTSPTCRQHC